MQNLVNASQIEDSPFTMLAYITTIRELIDDPDSPFKLSFDLNSHASGFFMTDTTDLEKKSHWNLTDHDISVSKIESDPIMLNRDKKYVKENMIKANGDETKTYNSRMPSFYFFVDN